MLYLLPSTIDPWTESDQLKHAAANALDLVSLQHRLPEEIKIQLMKAANGMWRVWRLRSEMLI